MHIRIRHTVGLFHRPVPRINALRVPHTHRVPAPGYCTEYEYHTEYPYTEFMAVNVVRKCGENSYIHMSSHRPRFATFSELCVYLFIDASMKQLDFLNLMSPSIPLKGLDILTYGRAAAEARSAEASERQRPSISTPPRRLLRIGAVAPVISTRCLQSSGGAEKLIFCLWRTLSR